MLAMDVDAGRVWGFGYEGSEDCLDNNTDRPKVGLFMDVADPEAGFTQVALPEGADPEQIYFAGGQVYLISADRIDVLDAEGESLERVEYTNPYTSQYLPAAKASALGLFLRDTERLQYLAPGADALASEEGDCSERYPVAADTDFVYLSSRDPAVPYGIAAPELTRVAVSRAGSSLELAVLARLPWGDARDVIASDDGAVAVMLPTEMMILR